MAGASQGVCAAPAVLGWQAEVWTASGRDGEWQGSGPVALADAICDPHHFYGLSAVYSWAEDRWGQAVEVTHSVNSSLPLRAWDRKWDNNWCGKPCEAPFLLTAAGAYGYRTGILACLNDCSYFVMKQRKLKLKIR